MARRSGCPDKIESQLQAGFCKPVIAKEDDTQRDWFKTRRLD